jgi:hypothetical protein
VNLLSEAQFHIFVVVNYLIFQIAFFNSTHNVKDELQAKEVSMTNGLFVSGPGYFLSAPSLCYKILISKEVSMTNGLFVSGPGYFLSAPSLCYKILISIKPFIQIFYATSFQV